MSKLNINNDYVQNILSWDKETLAEYYIVTKLELIQERLHSEWLDCLANQLRGEGNEDDNAETTKYARKEYVAYTHKMDKLLDKYFIKN